MLYLLRVFLISTFWVLTSLSFVERVNSATITSHNYFQFQIQQYHTQRQNGQTLNVYVRYALKDGLEFSQYPDYIPIRAAVLDYLEPTAELPADVYWEVIAERIGNTLYDNFPVKGVSIQLLVFPNEQAQPYEPGFHGPIYTKGKIEPLNVDPPVLGDRVNG
ncbi:hypothetical protein [Legionella nagasakiensis]|uniref:hypothetical protein n=1 Tax=Legionella nagasakiensis TaxID=535290 RepID=UPI00105435D5|nr:hypothetical protein [Legionella nagasakiensis]